MDKNRIIGAGKQIKGSIKEAVGKLVGDAKLQADGKAEQAEGKAQNLVGSIKDIAAP
ncbi:MAG: CsbD family protein [Azospirillaceae bacterium]|nr:CsbD family protein [Azospirillaceae bacterium]